MKGISEIGVLFCMAYVVWACLGIFFRLDTRRDHVEYSGMGISPWIEASQLASKLILFNIRLNGC